MKKALLIDMDGVLLDSTSIHACAFVESLDSLKIEIDFNYSAFAGMSTFDAMSRIAKDYNLDSNIVQRLTSLKRRKTEMAFAQLNDIPLFPNVAEVLTELSKVYRLALCTSASESTLKSFFRSEVDPNCFEHVISSTSIKKSKPDPEIYLSALSIMSLDSQDCIVIEDSIAGIIAGLNANIEVVQIGDQNLNEIRDRQNEILKRFRSFEEFSHWILGK